MIHKYFNAYIFSRPKCTRAPSLVDELLNEIYSRFSSTNGETTSDMSAPYHYSNEFEGDKSLQKDELQNFYGASRYISIIKYFDFLKKLNINFSYNYFVE